MMNPTEVLNNFIYGIMWLEIIKFIGQSINYLINSNKEKNFATSQLMWDIHLLLNDVITHFESNQFPHSSCSTMRILTDNLYKKISPALGDKSDYVCQLLKEASSLEKEFATRNSTDIINQLKVASGEFKAFSLLLKL